MPSKKNGAGSSAEGEKCAKMQRLSQVLSKAVDVSVESVGKDDLNKCFGEIASKIGGNLEGSFVKVLGRAQNLIEMRYNEICEAKKLNAHLGKLEKEVAGPGDDTLISSDDILSSTVIDVQRMEAIQLKEAITRMEAEIIAFNKRISKSKSEIQSQIDALAQEHDKYSEAANHMK
jgi:C4-type Zn-finger protein